MSEKRPGFIVNFFVRAFVGVCMIFFVNEFLAYQGINVAVGMNLFSFLTSGTLGIPGVALLYGISVYHFCEKYTMFTYFQKSGGLLRKVRI